MIEDQESASIANEVDYLDAVATLQRKRKPAKVLRWIMRGLESYRVARKLGWSRRQNKEGLTVFASYRLLPQADLALLQLSQAVLTCCANLTESARSFTDDLLKDPALMGFVFVHDRVEQGVRKEGATLSLGRVAPTSRRHRDRIDLVLESEVRDCSNGFSQGRLYVDPYQESQRRFEVLPIALDVSAPECCALFSGLVQAHRIYSGSQGRAFRHWTQEYIEYFADRTVPVRGTLFPTVIDIQAARASA